MKNTKPNRDITAEEPTTSTHNEHHHHFVGGQCIVCKLPTTSTEWEKSFDEEFDNTNHCAFFSAHDKDNIKDFISQALTTRTNELLGAMKMEKFEEDYDDPDYPENLEIFDNGYNKAIDEFNKKLATLRDKYSA